MNKSIQGTKCLAVPLLLCCLLLLLSAFTFAPIKVNASSSTNHTATTDVKTPMQPHCDMFVAWSSGSIAISPGINAQYPFTWGCSSIGVDLTWNVDWRDGSSGSYTCWVNCGDGHTTDLSHTYYAPGPYIAKIYWSGCSCVASWVTVNIAN
jgi:hypothetical protein